MIIVAWAAAAAAAAAGNEMTRITSFRQPVVCSAVHAERASMPNKEGD